MRLHSKLWLYGLLMICFGGCSGGDKPTAPGGAGTSSGTKTTPIGDTLRFTIVPYEAADKLVEEYSPMAGYLAKRMGKKEGRFFPVTDYAGVLVALQTGQVDVAYLSPFPYVLATSRMKLHDLAMPWVRNKLTYKGILFVRADSPIKTLADLAGHTVAFGDRASTSGYILPRALLEKEGVFGKLKSWRNAGNANVVVAAVENGLEDCGTAYELVFEVAYKDTPEKTKKMRIIGETAALPNGIYVARGDLPADEVAKLKQIFLDMNTDPEGRVVMLKAPNDKIVPPEGKLFDPVRETAKVLNLDLKDLEKK